MMISYSLFGTIPLLPYAIAEGVDSASRVGVFIASVVMALFSLALLGLLQVGGCGGVYSISGDGTVLPGTAGALTGGWVWGCL